MVCVCVERYREMLHSSDISAFSFFFQCLLKINSWFAHECNYIRILQSKWLLRYCKLPALYFCPLSLYVNFKLSIIAKVPIKLSCVVRVIINEKLACPCTCLSTHTPLHPYFTAFNPDNGRLIANLMDPIMNVMTLCFPRKKKRKFFLLSLSEWYCRVDLKINGLRISCNYMRSKIGYRSYGITINRFPQ